jgi:hypothetical protein
MERVRRGGVILAALAILAIGSRWSPARQRMLLPIRSRTGHQHTGARARDVHASPGVF